jgi:hypothetical protein
VLNPQGHPSSILSDPRMPTRIPWRGALGLLLLGFLCPARSFRVLRGPSGIAIGRQPLVRLAAVDDAVRAGNGGEWGLVAHERAWYLRVLGGSTQSEGPAAALLNLDDHKDPLQGAQAVHRGCFWRGTSTERVVPIRALQVRQATEQDFPAIAASRAAVMIMARNGGAAFLGDKSIKMPEISSQRDIVARIPYLVRV